ncbi:hypothetical protein ONZ51_g6795 [Trametes cubensis]|uniref:Uncharacterized protein n=1 Tax=Trametes cubensis TaxID=1111947 RepID=A0AAD7TRK4_9APHY|nr:hypothetical protein ONZ51_g6795 [Trametes cubensis]
MVELGDLSDEGSVDQLVQQLASAYLTGGEMALFAGMMDSLKNPKNKSPLQLFDSIAKNSSNATFQVGVASSVFPVSSRLPLGSDVYDMYRASGGNAMFKIGTYQYHASHGIDSVLFHTFGTQHTTFFAGIVPSPFALQKKTLTYPPLGNQTMKLDNELYSQVRNTVMQKLGHSATELVKAIEI